MGERSQVEKSAQFGGYIRWGSQKNLADVVETYIMPKVKFQQDTNLFNMQTGSIGWRLVQLCKVSPNNMEEQVLW